MKLSHNKQPHRTTKRTGINSNNNREHKFIDYQKQQQKDNLENKCSWLRSDRCFFYTKLICIWNSAFEAHRPPSNPHMTGSFNATELFGIYFATLYEGLELFAFWDWTCFNYTCALDGGMSVCLAIRSSPISDAFMVYTRILSL